MKTALITTEKKQELPILIVDKIGNFGEELAKTLKDESLVVLVTKKTIEEIDNVVPVPFLKKFPTIPDNRYSHIFLIDENLEITNEVLKSFLKKSQNDKSVLLLVANLSSLTDQFVSLFLNSYENSKIAVVGDVFKSDIVYSNATEVNKFILQAKTSQKIKIPGDGLSETAPVYFEDAVRGILEVVFGGEAKEKIFYIFPKHKVTLLSLAHMFQKANPELSIDFIKNGEAKQNNFIPEKEGRYVLGEKYDLEGRIKKIDFSKLEVSQLDHEIKEPRRNKRLDFKIPLFIGFLFFIFLLPLITTLIFTFIGAASLNSVKKEIENGNVSSSKNAALLASSSFDLALQTSALLKEEASIVGQADKVEDLILKIKFGKEVSNASISIIDAAEKVKGILSGTSFDPTSDFSNAVVEIKNALYIYNKEKENSLIPDSTKNKLTNMATIASSTIDFWPDILGFNNEKSYLVLLQNNMQLRPGGGFIDAYAIVNLDKGKITNFKIYNVYDADEQLKGHVEPPFPIRRYLPSANWYLRDSNFNIDFTKGAVSSAVFLNLEMRQSVDGVIAADLSFIKNLLSVTGPVTVSDYSEVVDEENFFQIVQANQEKDYLTGSSQKKDFLRSFYNALQIKMSQDKNISHLNLLEVLAKSVYEKHVLFTFNNVNQQAAFSINGWSSALLDERSKSDYRINDFMGINEASLGIDKISHLITRSISQVATIQEDGTVSEDLTMAFKNTSEGNYKNYLRVILPQGTKISKILFDNKEQKIVPAITDPAVYEKNNFTPPSGLEVHKEDQGKNSVYGFLINLGPRDLITIKIEYELLEVLNLEKPDYVYSLKVFKQPGIDSYPYEFLLNYPSSVTALSSSEEIKTSEQKTVFSEQIFRDKEIIINLAPK